MKDGVRGPLVAHIERLGEEAIGSLREPLKGAADEIVIFADGKRRSGLYGLFQEALRGTQDVGGLPPQVTLYAHARNRLS